MSQPSSPTNGTGPAVPSARWRVWHSAGLVVCAGGIAAVGLWGVPKSHLLSWAGVIALLALLTAVVGNGIAGRPGGVLIDRQNRFDIARLQLLVWTILITSGFYVAGMVNITAGESDPLRIGVPRSVLGLMGLGVTSAVGASMIQRSKMRRVVSASTCERAISRLEQRSGKTGRLTSAGPLVANRSAADAAAADLFTGDELGDAAYVNLGKLQFALVLLLGMILYTAALGAALQSSGPIRALPGLDDSLLTLVLISHTGFLARQAVPQDLDPA